MIRELLFGGRGLALGKGGLDAAALRQRTISQNVANAMTRGYVARSVEFEELIAEAKASIPLERTQSDHIQPRGDAVPRPRTTQSDLLVPEGAVNNVDVEEQMVLMKQNEVHYNALSQLVARRYKGIEGSIR